MTYILLAKWSYNSNRIISDILKASEMSKITQLELYLFNKIRFYTITDQLL